MRLKYQNFEQDDCSFKVRLDLNELEYRILIDTINRSNFLEVLKDRDIDNTLLKKLQSFKQIKKGNKNIGAIKAREALQEQTKEKIQNAINLLKFENKKITAYSIAKTANISYNTAKKYLSKINLFHSNKHIEIE